MILSSCLPSGTVVSRSSSANVKNPSPRLAPPLTWYSSAASSHGRLPLRLHLGRFFSPAVKRAEIALCWHHYLGTRASTSRWPLNASIAAHQSSSSLSLSMLTTRLLVALLATNALILALSTPGRRTSNVIQVAGQIPIDGPEDLIEGLGPVTKPVFAPEDSSVGDGLDPPVIKDDPPSARSKRPDHAKDRHAIAFYGKRRAVLLHAARSAESERANTTPPDKGRQAPKPAPKTKAKPESNSATPDNTAAHPSLHPSPSSAPADFIFTDLPAVLARKRACTLIVLRNIKVPAGETLDLNNLQAGTQVIFDGNTTFGYAEWPGPLITVSSSNNITVTGSPGAVIDYQGARW